MRRLPIHFVRQRFVAASEDQIAEIECRFGVRLPDDYRRFLLTRGSMSEFLPPANSYVQIGPIDDVIPVNKAGDIQRRFPGALVIGSDGSREMLAYDFRQAKALWSCSTSPLRIGRTLSTKRLHWGRSWRSYQSEVGSSIRIRHSPTSAGPTLIPTVSITRVSPS